MKDCAHVPELGGQQVPPRSSRPTIEELREYLDYEPETGVLRWKRPRGTMAAGSIACRKPNKDGYHRLGIDGRYHYAHRVAFALANGKWPSEYCDHINGNRGDNRACNLREATAAQNQHNAKISTKNTSGAKGVFLDKRVKRWRARVTYKGRYYYCGSHDSVADAQEAVSRKRAELHGKFARH